MIRIGRIFLFYCCFKMELVRDGLHVEHQDSHLSKMVRLTEPDPRTKQPACGKVTRRPTEIAVAILTLSVGRQVHVTTDKLWSWELTQLCQRQCLRSSMQRCCVPPKEGRSKEGWSKATRSRPPLNWTSPQQDSWTAVVRFVCIVIAWMECTTCALWFLSPDFAPLADPDKW